MTTLEVFLISPKLIKQESGDIKLGLDASADGIPAENPRGMQPTLYLGILDHLGTIH